MENKAKILLLNERVAFVYCRIYYELDLPNSHAVVVTSLVKYYLMLGGNERPPEGRRFASEARSRLYSSAVITFSGFT